MQIELKNLHADIQKDNVFFDADLWINGKVAGYVTYMSGASMAIKAANSQGEGLIQAAKDYCLTLPALEISSDRGKKSKIKMDLEVFIKSMVADSQQKPAKTVNRSDSLQQKKTKKGPKP
ncbi:hypothetical protein [Puia dinghuensis]|uniref:Uncharacterized protein n=1 Tax=Puia dinghuensis TaxID=1792502 RepID=A0A8J2XWX2_9BACT|nr:hypothetical protein [Puia dinghuensis]GGB26160.1 hypothetical protein GCM10011511_57660 [Puia dinghuensis]